MLGFSDDNSSVTVNEGGPAKTICVDVKQEGLPLDPFDRVTLNLRTDGIPGINNYAWVVDL